VSSGEIQEKGKEISKKLMTLALAAVGAAAFVLPASALAIVPLHSLGTNGEVGAVTGGAAKLSDTSGLTVTCGKFSGSQTYTNSTSGTLRLTFTEDCKESFFGTTCSSAGEPSGSITTEPLSFELATLQRAASGESKVPGVLIKPPASGIFASFNCGLVNITITGNGVLGKITSPGCGGKSKTSTIAFEATAHGVQRYKTLESTATEYSLMKGGNTAAQEATGTVTTTNERPLECT
jgi:hypothetical protein